ncbi:MAG: DEAD/DEAH box helicase [Ignavibacteria bacterium]|nr:DEAD/DEAH box helicase [Ignavibacteria bacterium]
MSFELLSEPIKKYIRDKRWEQLRPIQNAAIERILTTNNNYILASRTASGKTEAAFLPILSKLDFSMSGIQVLYISPLIALINDQFYRIEELCKYLDVTVTKWHGEANRTLKNKILKNPNGVLLITPESLEAMFINKPYNVKLLFTHIKFIVIDEIHSFLGTDRGTQLKSILSRLKKINSGSFSIIGLSATIGDYNEAKRFTGDEMNTKVLLDRTSKEIIVKFRYFNNDKSELSLELLKDLYLSTKESKALIFPNSRGKAEEIAVKLLKISKLDNGHNNYFSHHSSVDKEVREFVEYFAKNNKRQNFCISCTSTLELGIDIGTVDQVIQIDSAHSIASLIQRVGRSGRKEGEFSKLLLYSTNKWSLIQSLACWLLYEDGFIEPPQSNIRPFDLLLHQALSITKGHSGIEISDLANQLNGNFAFAQISKADILELIYHLIKLNYLEKLREEVIIGIEGEKIVNNRNFYSVFRIEENFKFIYSGNKIGEIPFSPQLIEGENIFLAAKIWKIRYIDFSTKRVEVVPANDGKPPIFSGSTSSIHPIIRERILQILFSENDYEFLDTESRKALDSLRLDFSIFPIEDVRTDRPIIRKDRHLQFFSFTGTKINHSLQFLFTIAGIKNRLDENCSKFELEITKESFIQKWSELTNLLNDIDAHIEVLLENSPNLLDFSKWGYILPKKYQASLLKEKYFDFQDTAVFLNRIKFVSTE